MSSENLKTLKELTQKLTTRDIKIKEELNLINIILGTFSDGYWYWDIKEKYEYYSSGFSNMLGLKKNELNSTPESWRKYAYESSYDEVESKLKEHFKNKGENLFECEVQFSHKKGNSVWMLCRGKVIEWDKNGKASKMVGINTNITNIKND